jgi:hypothetical protein
MSLYGLSLAGTVMKDDSTAAAVCPARADQSARARGRFDASQNRCIVGLLVEQPREDLGAVADLERDVESGCASRNARISGGPTWSPTALTALMRSVARHREHVRRRSDERDPLALARRGELGILRAEPIAGMNGVAPTRRANLEIAPRST